MTDLIDTYDTFVDDMLVSKGNIKDWTIAIAEETGELCGKVKRLNRGDYEHNVGQGEKVTYPKQFVDDAVKELGDILYYLTAAAHDLGYSLTDIVEGNVGKLTARKEAGTLRGNGDNR